MKVIHLSDLHCAEDESFESLIRLAEAIKSATCDWPEPLAVVVTGDLVDNACIAGRKGFERVRDTLRQAFPAPRFRILVCPGNHDYGTGKNADPSFVPLFKEVFFGHKPNWNDPDFYPVVDTIGDTAFLALDSTAEEFDFLDMAQGEIGPGQLQRLADRLRQVKECRKRVVYLHHDPFYHLPGMRLRDHKAFRCILKSAIDDGISIDLLLYGHSHRGVYRYWGWPEVMQCFDGGTSLKYRGDYANDNVLRQSSVVRVIDVDGLTEL
jgi:3',5'-cyclic AMP phosphodiesterase CpdA